MLEMSWWFTVRMSPQSKKSLTFSCGHFCINFALHGHSCPLSFLQVHQLPPTLQTHACDEMKPWNCPQLRALVCLYWPCDGLATGMNKCKKPTTKLIIDEWRWVFLCCTPAWLHLCGRAAVLFSTLRSAPYCFILVAGFLLTPFPLPHLYRFLLELDI